MRRILGISSIRSDYDLMSQLYKSLNEDPDVDFGILVSGAHLSPAYGYSAELIRQDGLKIIGEVETLINGDSKSSRLKTASCFLSGSIDLIRTFNPDVMIFAGDREDVLIAAMIGGFLGIPTAHFFGGDHASDGHIDNPVRHATSKLSTVHFVSIEEHKKRLQSIGEHESRIFVIGSVALDKFCTERLISKDLLLEEIVVKQHGVDHPLALLIFHPVEQEKSLATRYIKNAAEALIDSGHHVLIGYPNTDPGNYEILEIINELSERPEVTIYKNLSRTSFVNLLRNVKILAGNSSSGILEAASLKLPVINVGERQRGRLAGCNVLFVDGELINIKNAIKIIATEEFQSKISLLSNPYGTGVSSKVATEILKTFNFSGIVKKTEDPIDARS
jgi:UDP-hydrolysing UDP-N-acetyl-D-glucosamine 2-epimerase